MEEKGKVSPALRFKNLWDKIFLNYRFLKKKLYFSKRSISLQQVHLRVLKEQDNYKSLSGALGF